LGKALQWGNTAYRQSKLIASNATTTATLLTNRTRKCNAIPKIGHNNVHPQHVSYIPEGSVATIRLESGNLRP
jgi:hypothetical protein